MDRLLRYRLSLLILISMLVLTVKVPADYGQSAPQVQLFLVGSSTGQYYAPAGEITELKVEILDVGPSDVYLVRGEAYLDPNLSGNWQLAHSEDTGDFHLTPYQSAIWTFNLPMPRNVVAGNATGGVPQVYLLIKIIYSAAGGQQGMASAQFSLNVPGATLGQVNYDVWLLLVSAIVVLVAGGLYYRKVRRHSHN